MEIWQLVEQHMPLNKMFPMPQSPDSGFKVPKWILIHIHLMFEPN
jgi:hypothetical protein